MEASNININEDATINLQDAVLTRGYTTDVVVELRDVSTTGVSAFWLSTGSSHVSIRVSRMREGGEKPTLCSPISDLL